MRPLGLASKKDVGAHRMRRKALLCTCSLAATAALKKAPARQSESTKETATSAA